MEIIVNYTYDKVMIGMEVRGKIKKDHNLQDMIKTTKEKVESNLKESFETGRKFIADMEDLGKFDYVIDVSDEE